MRNFPLTIILIACWLVLATCEQFGHESVPSGANRGANTLLGASDLESVSDNNDPNNIDKRVERYAFGLGRRAYTYTSGGSGVKRLPVYNFGLGKRARPYSFGLGKRFDVDNQEYQDFDGNNNDEGLYELPASSNNNKRNRPYSFGLGKRETLEDMMERRSQAQRYNFGLGR